MKRTVFGVFCAAMLVCVVFLSSCQKEEETIATVIVKNELGAPVQGATVWMYAYGSTGDDGQSGQIRYDTTGVTNASGKVSFNFSEHYNAGQAGFAILDIEATKGSLFGSGLIKIEEMKTNEETVVIE